MTDRLIIFSAPMVLALLDGRKSQTRRVLRNTGAGRGRCNIFNAESACSDSYVMDPGNSGWREHDTPYAPGDRLWVKEAHAFDIEANTVDEREIIWYRATQPVDEVHWRSPIHMPRWASRLTLTVTDVRVQRLNELTDTDAIAEGINVTRDCAPSVTYAKLWDDLNKKRGFSWQSNPWVVALTFRTEFNSVRSNQ